MGSKQIQDFDTTTLVDTDYIVVQTSSGAYKKVDGAQLRALRSVSVGDIEVTLRNRTLSSDEPYLDLAIPSRNLDIANFLDYVPYLRAIQAGLKWTSTQVTGTITLASTAMTGSGTNLSADLSAGNLVFVGTLNQFRYMATITSTTAATVDEPGTAAAGATLFKITKSTAYNDDFSFTAAQVTNSTSFSLYINYGDNTKYPENYVLLRALAEAYAYDREYCSITLPSSFGGIPAGDYTITSVTLANVGSSSPAIVCQCSGLSTGALSTGSGTLNAYPYRIAGSTTTARHKELTDAAIMNDGLYNVLGLAQRDAMQGWQAGSNADATGALDYYMTIHTRNYVASGVLHTGSGVPLAAVQAGTAAGYGGQGVASMIKAMSDGTNESPRTGSRTRPRSGIFNYYTYVGTYTA
jgi:hypothetical protein